ncbi:patatin-like phospholipase family protein [Bacteroides sp. f07]
MPGWNGSDAYAQERRKVGLVLGGGGAKGAAEIGVLKVLEEAEIPIDYIAGTSIGAIVGGLYAIGYDAAALDSMYRNQDWLFLIKDQVKRESKAFLSKEEKEKYQLHIPLSKEKKVAFTSGGYVAGQNILNLFSKLTVGYHSVDRFSDLPIPFRCVAVDIVEGKEVVLDSGSLPLAMRASMSIPGVFAPVEWNGMLLVDGGALNNLPVDVVKKMGAEVVICIDLSTGWRSKEELKSASTVLDQLVGIMGQPKYRSNKEQADLYINPALKGYNAASFQTEAIDTMLLRGEQAARDRWDDLLALRRYIYHDNAPDFSPEKTTRPCLAGTYSIGKIEIEGIGGKEKEWVRRKIGLQEYSEISQEEIDRALVKLQGFDIFSRVEYRLGNTDPHDLVFLLEMKDYRKINIGVRFDTEELAGILVNLSNNQQLATKHHYSVTGRISKNPYLEAGYAFGHLFGAKFGASYRLGYHDFDLYAGKHDVGTMKFASHALAGYYTRDIANFRMKIGAQFEYFDYRSELFERQGTPHEIHSDAFLNYFADFTMDTYDRVYYPTHGSRIQIRGTLYTDDGISYDGEAPSGALDFHAGTAIRLGSRLCLLPSVQGRFLFSDDLPYIYRNYVGGIVDADYLPWQKAWESVQNVHIVERNFAAAKLALRYRIHKKIYATALGEYGKENRKIEDMFSGGDLWGCALRVSYDFLLGPIAIQANYSNLYKNVGVYMSAGFKF